MPKGVTDSERVLPIVQLVRREVDRTGMTLRDFAGDRGVSYGTLRRYYDKGLQPLRSPARLQTMQELADALGVEIGEVETAFIASTVSGQRAMPTEYVQRRAAENEDDLSDVSTEALLAEIARRAGQQRGRGKR